MADFKTLLDHENALALSTLQSHKELFEVSINAWEISTMNNYFWNPSIVNLIAISYKVQVDKANFLVISNVLRRHYSAALTQLRMAIDYSVITLGLLLDTEKYIEIIKSEKNTNKLDQKIRDLSRNILSDHSDDISEKFKLLKSSSNLYGPHASYGHLGSNVVVNENASKIRMSYFDKPHKEMDVGILGSVLLELTFFHDAVMKFDKSKRELLINATTIKNMTIIENEIIQLKKDNLHLFNA